MVVSPRAMMMAVASVLTLAAWTVTVNHAADAIGDEASAIFRSAQTQPDRAKAAALIRQAIALERKQHGESLELANYQAALCPLINNQAEAGQLFAQVYKIRKDKAPNDARTLNATAARLFSTYPGNISFMVQVGHDWTARLEKTSDPQKRELYDALVIINTWTDHTPAGATTTLPFLRQIAELQRIRESHKAHNLVDDSYSRRLAATCLILKLYAEAAKVCSYCLQNEHSKFETAAVLMNLADANAHLGKKAVAKQEYEEAEKLWQSPDVSRRHLEFLTAFGYKSEAEQLSKRLKAKESVRDRLLEDIVTPDKISRLNPDVLRSYKLFKGYNQFLTSVSADINGDGVITPQELQRFSKRKAEEVSYFDPEAEAGLLLVSQELQAAGIAVTKQQLKQREQQQLEDLMVRAIATGTFAVPEKAVIIEALNDRFDSEQDAQTFVAHVNNQLKQRRSPCAITIGKPNANQRFFTIRRVDKVISRFAIPDRP